MSDFMSPKITPPIVVQAFVEQALKADPVLADLKNDGEFNALKPDAVTVPTLVLFGENDPGVVADDAGKFFARLGTPDKQMVCCPAPTTRAPRGHARRVDRGRREFHQPPARAAVECNRGRSDAFSD